MTASDQLSVFVSPPNQEQIIFGQNSYGGYSETVSTLMASGGNNGGGSENLALTGNLIRKLLPVEAERLMGFPDHYTDIPGCSDSARYRALGNSVVVNCVSYIMKNIVDFLENESEGE